jgi:PPOX class probable F420-dependent enzyme
MLLPDGCRRMCGMTTFPESHHDLLDADIATLATIGPNCMPQQTAVWFLHEDGKLKLSLNTSRIKTKNLMKRPQCSLLVLDPAVPQRYLEVRGTPEIEPDDDYAFARKLGAKYGGVDLSAHDGPGDSRVIVTIEPTNVYAVDVRIGQM